MGLLASSKDLVCELLDPVLLKWWCTVDTEHTCTLNEERVNVGVDATGGHYEAAEVAGQTPAKVSREQWMGLGGHHFHRGKADLRLASQYYDFTLLQDS